MFIAILLIALSFVGFVTFRDWISLGRISRRERKKRLTRISHALLREEWEVGRKELMILFKKGGACPEAYLFYAKVLRGTKHYRRCDSLLKHAMTLYPFDRHFFLEQGKLFLTMERFEEALHSYREASSLIRSELDLLEFATAALKANDLDTCLDILRPIIASNSNSATYALAGDCMNKAGRYEEALDCYEKALEKGARTHQILLQMAKAYQSLKNFTTAEHIYRHILDKDSGDVEATLGLGSCMQEQGHYQRALLIYSCGKAWGKKDPRLLYEAGRSALYAQRYSYAEEYFTQALTQPHPSLDLFIHLGLVLEKQEKWHEAQALYLHLLSLFPHDPHAPLSLAYLFAIGHATADVLPHCEHALSQSDPHSLELYSACLARAGHFDQALTIQEHLSSLDTEKPARSRRSQILRLLRQKMPLTQDHLTQKYRNMYHT